MQPGRARALLRWLGGAGEGFKTRPSWTTTNSSNRTPRWRVWGSLKSAFEQMGAMGFDAVALARYPQVERIHHVHHAGNSSGIVDGAAGGFDCPEAAGKTHGFTPRARIVAAALSGADPTIMLTGPMPAARKALAKSVA